MKKKYLVSLLVLVLAFSALSFTSAATDDVYLVTSIRTVRNPYQAAVAKGSELFAKAMGMEDRWILLQCDHDSLKQISDIQAVIARFNGKVVFYVDPNEAPDAVPIARI